MNWRALKAHFHLFDERGLDGNAILTLRLMIVSVAFGIVWSNITTGVAMTGYMKELGATDTLYGLVIALPNIANAFQFLCSYWLEHTRKPKRMMLFSGLLQRLIWVPFALIPFFIPMQNAQLRLWAAVVMALVSATMAPFMSVAFYTIATDAVPMRIRGRYFATRTRVSTLVGLVVGLLVGVLLDRLPGFTGYMVAFALAGVFGSLDIACYTFMKPSPMPEAPKHCGMWTMMKGVLRDKSYMKTVLAITAFLFSVQLSSPYYNVYLRSVLQVSNFDIILTGQIANNLLLILCISRWGAAIDRYGNKPVFLVAALFTAITPFWWIRVAASMLPLIFFANAWSGGTYCAVDLTIQNLFMAQAKPVNRSMYFAVYFIFTQLFGLAFASFAGGALLDGPLAMVDAAKISLMGVPFTKYNALFVISGLLRLLSTLTLLPTIDETGCQRVGDMLKDAWRGCLRSVHGLFSAIRAKFIRKRALTLDD